MGPYEIVNSLGAGGMGEVYRARDTRLDRTVAIKVLPDALGADRMFRERFDREARAISSLSHPNICTLFDVGERESTSFLVMECLEGTTLAHRLEQGPLPITEAIQVAMQIAAALDAAHERGIIHRDLKPGNVMLTKAGVKVLDFGLAKEFKRPSSLANSPTFTMAAPTQAGMIMGTAAYMSPEQARGLEVDARADIWAFGAVLFEMVSGKQVFDGTTATDVFAAIIRGEPDWTALPRDTPPALVTLMRRCLRKDPAKRLHAIADAALELEEITSAPAAAVPTAASPSSRSWFTTFLPWGVALLAAAIAVGMAMKNTATSPGTGAALRVQISPPPGIEFFSSFGHSIAISPDGKLVALVGIQDGVRRIYLRRLDGFEAAPLRGTENVVSLFFSHDSTRIAIIGSDRGLRVYSIAEATVTLLARGADRWGGTWLEDDTLVYVTVTGLMRISAAGGTPRQLTTVGQKERHQSPHALRGQQALLFASVGADSTQHRVETVSLVDGSRKVLIEGGGAPLPLAGRLLFSRDNDVYQAPFDAATQKITGSIAKADEDIVVRGGGLMVASASDAGDLLFMPRIVAGAHLIEATRSGAERLLNDAPRSFGNPRLSPDAKRLVVEELSGDLWLQDIVRGTFTRLTLGDTFANGYPVWARDGRIVYRTGYDVRVIAPDTGNPGRLIPAAGPDDFPSDVAPDGSQYAFVRLTPERSGDILLADFTSKDPKALLNSTAYEGGLRFSRDGKWYVYSSNESGKPEIYMRRMDGEGKWPVSTGGGLQPVWAGESNEIFYRFGSKIMVVKVLALGKDGPTLAAPQELFDRPYAYGANISIANFDVTPDGQRFYMVRPPTDGRLHLVLSR
jgi:serine/threonine-protein kinase